MKSTKNNKSWFVRTNLDGSKSLKMRPIRWLICIFLALAFVLSYHLDVQVLEGSMIASRLMGFHMVDLFSGLEVAAAHGKIAVNLLMGLIFVTTVYLILGGRSFCSWACPYGLLSEWAELIHKRLVALGIIKKRKKITTRWKYFIAVCFLLASYFSGYLVYQYVNLVGITSRILIYGLLETGLIVLFVLAIEVFFFQRLWCRSVCPSGAAFGLLGKVSLIRLEADTSKCDKCGACTPECHVPEALKVVFAKRTPERNARPGRDQSSGTVMITSTDCTLCGKCMDSCDRKVFTFGHRLKKLI